MTYSLSLRPRALAEIEAVGHGDSFLDELDAVFEVIQAMPLCFPIVFGTVHRALLRRLIPARRETCVRFATMNDVTCVRCHASVPAMQADLCADGMVCRSCMTSAATGGRDAAVLERELSRSTGRKEIITGFVLLTLGIAILSIGAGSGGLMLVPTGMLAAGVFELGRGFTRLG